MSFCVCGPERSSTISALQSSLTQRRLFKIMCWGFFFFFLLPQSILSFQPVAGWVEAGHFLGLPWLPAKWNNWLRSITSSCQRCNKDILPIIPCCHWWVSRNNYQTLCHFFFSPSFLFSYFFFFSSCSAAGKWSLLVCVCLHVSSYDTQRHSAYEILMTRL